MNSVNHLNCVVCGYLTITERGAFEICPICSWEDDGVAESPDVVEGGPNGDLSINAAKENFKKWGAVTQDALEHVRGPQDDEWVEGLPSPEEIRRRQENARAT